MKVSQFVFYVFALLMGFMPLNATSVLHVAGVDIPNVEYDFVVGKADGLLHFFKQDANADSIWISSFTCNTQGYFSDSTVIYSYHFAPSFSNVPTLLLFEYRYEKLYLLAQIGFTSIIACVLDENGNSYSHLIDTDAVDFAYLYSPGSNKIVLFNENTILAATARTGNVYKIDLDALEIEMILTYPNSMYQMFPLMDDYVIVSDLLHDYVPNYFIDGNMDIHDIPRYMPYGYYEATKVGEYYMVKGVNATQGYAYSLLYIQNNMLVENILSEGANIIAEDDCIVPLDNFRYIAIFKKHYCGGSDLHTSFTAYNISNGVIAIDNSFPQLISIPNPRNLFRINDNCIVALSGTFGSPINFTSFNPNTQEYNTDSYQIDTDSYQWEWLAYPSGNNFYLIKGRKLHTFSVVSGNGALDLLAPRISSLSCYPNPFTDGLDIDIKLSNPSRLTVNIYDVRGRKLKSIILEDNISRGNIVRLTMADIQGMRMSSGVYFVQVVTGKELKVIKTLYLK